MESYASRASDTSKVAFSLDYISGFARERVAVGFVVSTATWVELAKRFPPGKKKLRAGDTFNATPIVVDPEAPANTCEAFYDREAFATRCRAIGGAK